jgi:hypothetical protein
MSRTLRTILQDLRYIVNSQGKRDYFLSLKTMTMPLLSPLDNDRFLTHLAQLFLYRGRPEAGGEQEMMSCLKKRVKINVSIFSG